MNDKIEKNNGDELSTSDVFDGLIRKSLSPVVEFLTKFFFRKIDFDSESLQTLKAYSGRVNMVYTSFHSSNISLLIIYKLLKKHNLEMPVFALEYNPFILQTLQHIIKRIVKLFSQFVLRKKYKYILATNYIEKLIQDREVILLSLLSRKFFLRRYMEIKYDTLIYLIEVQKRLDSPIYLFPEMIFWNMNPERSRSFVSSKATGDRGLISGWITTLKSTTPAFVRISTPINLKEEIVKSETENPEQIAIIVRNKLFEIYHHEKMTVLGPVMKSQQEMSEKVLYHRDVLAQIEKLSKRQKIPEKRLRKEAYKYYKEIASDFSIVYIKFFSSLLDIIFKKLFDGISYNMDSIKKIREAAKMGPLIIVPCHKSHMDYLILSKIFYQNKLMPPHIAAGANLSFFPLGNLFRHSGAFFIRRSFKGLKLYTVIFRQYIRTIISENYPIEFFIEGGRTRTGKLVFPKVGLLGWLVEAIYKGYNRDLVFVPVSINYDRIIEEKSYIRELKGNQKKTESVASVMKGRKLLKKKYGRVYVSFNDVFTLQEIAEQGTDIKKIPDEIAKRILNGINEVTVVTPFAITACAILLLSKRGFSRSMLQTNIIRLYNYLVYLNAEMSDTLKNRSNIDEIIEHVIKSYLHDHILEEIYVDEEKKRDVVENFYILRDENRTSIGFYKNCIIHYLIPIAYVSISLLSFNSIHPNGRKKIEKSNLRLEYEFIKEFFIREFIYSDGKDDSENCIHNSALDYLLANSIISKIENDSYVLNEDREGDIKFYSRVIEDYLESYYVVLYTLLNIGTDNIIKKNLIVDIRKNNIKMYYLGTIHLPESLSLPNYNNALTKFSDEGIIKGFNSDNDNAELKIVNLEKAKELFDKIRIYLNVIG